MRFSLFAHMERWDDQLSHRQLFEDLCGTPRPDLMVLRHTYVHNDDEPDGWRPGAAAINRSYRTFDAWAGNKAAPVDGFLDPSPEEKFAGRPEFTLESLHETAMIGPPDEVIRRIRHYADLGVDEFSFWADNGMTHEQKKKSLQLFIDHVVPNDHSAVLDLGRMSCRQGAERRISRT